MPGEIMYDLNEINNNALQIFNQAVKSLNDAAECLNGISTSGLDLQLNTEKIKAEIIEKRSIITSTIASIINTLRAFAQVEKDNIKILDALIYSIGFFKGLFDIFKAPEKEEIIRDETESEVRNVFPGATEWITRIVKKGNQLIREIIPIFPDCYQKDDKFANIAFGRNDLTTDGCGLFSTYYVLRFLGNMFVTPEFLAENLYRGVSTGVGSDGSIYGGLAQLLEFCGAHIVERGQCGDFDAMMEQLEQGNIIQVLVRPAEGEKCFFTEKGHFITLVGLTEEGKVIVYDSYELNITNNTAHYKEGFDLKTEIVPYVVTYLAIDPEPRKELQTNADGEIIVTEEGKVLLIDYTEEPIVDADAFEAYCTDRNALIRESGFWPGDITDAKIRYETDGKGKINITQTDETPIQFPTKEITIEEALEIGAITEEDVKAQGLLP